MKRFIKNSILFLLLALVIGEAVVRLTHAMSDIPQRTIDDQGIQKYYPNQKGYWKGGDHTWLINKMGWPGQLPESFDNLVMVIGDSYIENFMNPNECHQAILLKENMKAYNFMEAARSGVSLIEAMEISKQLDSLRPLHNLIYVNDNDFYESIVEVKPMQDITQLSIKDNSIAYGEMKAPGIKKVLYNWKLLYYFYNRFPLSLPKKQDTDNSIKEKQEDTNILKHKAEIKQLLAHIVKAYTINNKTLVFHPDCNTELIEMCREAGFKTIVLDSSVDSKSWSFDHDSHWTCYGHERAAGQVARALNSNKSF